MRFRSGLVVLLIGAQATTGCATLVGTGVGTAVDAASGPVKPTLAGLYHLSEDRKIRVRLRTGETVEGWYRGLPFSSEEYAERYAKRSPQSEKPALPALGESVSVVLERGSRVTGRLAGFDPRRIVVDTETRGEQTFDLERIAALTPASGAPLWPGTFARLESSGAVPYRSRLAVGDGLVNLEDVQSVELPGSTPNTGKAFGAMLGAILDTAFVIALANTHFD